MYFNTDKADNVRFTRPPCRTTVALYIIKRHAHLAAIENRAQYALRVMKQTWKAGIRLTYFSTFNKNTYFTRAKKWNKFSSRE